MGQTPGDKSQPSLELPSLSPFGRRKKEKEKKSRRRGAADSPERSDAAAEAVVETPTAPLPAYQPPETYAAPAQDRQPVQDLEPVEDPAPIEDPAPADVPLGEPAPEPEPRRRQARRSRTERSAPRVPGGVAAAVTGALVGAAGGAATYGAMTGCEIVRGVSTCGGAPGFFILVAIFALMVLLGGGILRLLRVEAPGSTSFLAVGLVAVVVMLALLDVIFSAWMFVVIPLLGALAYVLAHWVTTRFDDETIGRRDWT